MITYLKVIGAFILAIGGFFLGKSRQELKNFEEKNEELKITIEKKKKYDEISKNIDNLDRDSIINGM